MNLAWNTGSGDNNIVVGVAGSLSIAAGQSLANGNFTFEKSGSDVTVGVTNASVSMGGGTVSVNNLAPR